MNDTNMISCKFRVTNLELTLSTFNYFYNGCVCASFSRFLFHTRGQRIRSMCVCVFVNLRVCVCVGGWYR